MIVLRPLTLFEVMYLAISAAGFLGVIITLIVLHRQTTISHRGLKESLLIPLKTQQLEFDKMFFSSPNMRKYFYAGATIPDRSSEEFAKASAMAEYLLDHIAAVIPQTTVDNVPLLSTIWREYIKDSFKNSPILCEILTTHQRWYPAEILHLMNEALAEVART